MWKMPRARLALILLPLLTPKLCFGGSASIPMDVHPFSGCAALWSGADTLTPLHQRSYNECGRASVEKQRARLALVLPPQVVPGLCSGCSAKLPRDVRWCAGGEGVALWRALFLSHSTLVIGKMSVGALSDLFHIAKTYSTAYRPQANSRVECCNCTLLAMLRYYGSEHCQECTVTTFHPAVGLWAVRCRVRLSNVE